MKLIESKTLGTAQAAIEFTSIPQDGTDLLLVTSLRSVDGSNGDYGFASFNSSTANFSARYLFGTGSAAFSNAGPGGSGRMIAHSMAANDTANTFANSACYIPNYSGATAKSFSVDAVRESNATGTEMGIVAGLWNNTAAITSITISSFSTANWAAGCIASLYKITKGSDGIVTTS
jgi:hypothetical protein